MHLNNKRYIIFKHGYNASKPQRLIALVLFMSTKRSKIARYFAFFILFLLLNLFLSFGVICIIRKNGWSAPSSRDHPSASTLRPAVRTVPPEYRANPIVLLSKAIENALKDRNYVQLSELIRRAPSEALYSYTRTYNYGRHFIHLAIWDTEALPVLLQSPHLDINRNCLLHHAVKKFWDGAPNPLEYNDALISHGADVNLPDSSGQPPLAYAIRHENRPLIDFLLARSAKLNISFSTFPSFLHFAVLTKQKAETISFLINRGANPFHRGPDGLNPFHHSLLLDSSSNRDQIIDAFLTSIHPRFTADPAHYRSKLLNYPISPSSTTTFPGYTPLHLAVDKIRSAHHVLKFLQNGARRDSRDIYGRTPLQLAEALQHPDIIYTLTN